MDLQKNKDSFAVKYVIPAVASAAVMVALTLVVSWLNIPNPNMILITGLVVFTSLYGYLCGVICAIDMIVYSMYFFSTDNDFVHYTSQNLQKMAVILFGTVVSVIFIGQLKLRRNEATRELNEMNELLKEDNALLKEASSTDTLTGAKNRFAFRRDYGEKFGDNRRIHVMMVDIDDFKEINDNYGHAAGDEALKAVCSAVMSVFGTEFCYRYGGDEFLVVSNDKSEEQFVGMLERMKEEIDSIDPLCGVEKIRFSAGYVHGVIGRPEDLRLMLRQADSNLYKAKDTGKSKYVGSEYRAHGALKLD